MKKIYPVLLLILWFGYSRAQNYTQSAPFDTTLHTGTYAILPGCTSSFPLKIQLNSSLFTYVSGMQFLVIIDSVNFAGPSSVCPVKKGDTTVLNSANPSYSTIAISGLNYWFRIELAGTPTIPGQSYPCQLEVVQCLCACTDITIRPSTTNTTTCFVNLANSVNELNDSKSISVYPNPVSDKLSVKGITGETTIKIYNVTGQLVLKKVMDSDTDLSISDLNQGIYWAVLSTEGQKTITVRIVVAR